MDWTDATSYRQGERGTTPRAWSISTKSGLVRIVITKDHIAYKGEWIMHAYGLGIDTFPLKLPGDVKAEIAQHAALNIATNRAKNLALEVSRILKP